MVDVCLILEGTYPYVTGGVSSWVHQLIRGLPEVSFGIVYIASSSGQHKSMKYQLPANIQIIEELFLHDYDSIKNKTGKNKHNDKISSEKMLQSVIDWEYPYYKKYIEPLFRNSSTIPDLNSLVFSEHTWKVMLEEYQENEDQSFLDFFWTWRFIHLPVFKLFEARIPKARMYHTISTGYAGFLAALAKIKYNVPMLLTEHGIYTKERKIEIQSADWIYQSRDIMSSHDEKMFFRKWWINMFSFLGVCCYDYADKIISLFNGNRIIQIQEGANAEKASCIPNGIDILKYRALQKSISLKEGTDTLVLGFVGRVVPIKDVKTFLRAFKIISEKFSSVSAVILGPYDEDYDYYQECRQLVSMLGLEQKVEFTGPVNMMERYPDVDVLVLTSISEAQPLVILEANVLGIPCVATNVGACNELLNGTGAEDRFGPSGIITNIADPEDTAEACISLLKDKGLRKEMGKNGIKRVETFYRQDSVLSRYASIYSQLME